MSHDPETSGVEVSDPDAFSTVTVGIAGSILLVVIIVALVAMYEQVSRREFERKVVAEAPQELRSVRVDQLQQLSTYRWQDRRAGVVAIPIERAMELVVEEHRNRANPSAPAPGR